MTTFNDFYNAMRALKQLRSKLLGEYLDCEILNTNVIASIQTIQHELSTLPQVNEGFILKTENNETLSIELDYELNELEKDKAFFDGGIEGLKAYLTESHPDFENELEQGLSFLNGKVFDHLFTDRDGTVSNYCGRYLSSIQGVGNAVLLNKAAKAFKGQRIILTAAPLLEGGLTEVSIQPKPDFILAGSKGREFLDEKGDVSTLPIEKEKQALLDELYRGLEDLLERKNYSIFKYTGSGLQRKFGEVALARQNKDFSIPTGKSLDFKAKVIECIKKVDPDRNTLVLDDTGKDLEINLSFDQTNGQDFNKGNGLEFIAKSLNLQLKNRTVLICGDTFSDVPMLNAAQNLGAEVHAIFVTQNEDLKQNLRSLAENALFVSSPDVLVFLLYEYVRL